MSEQQRLVATRTDMPSNGADRERETLLLRNKERSPRGHGQVPMSKKRLSRDFESSHFAQAESGHFSARLPAFLARSVSYHPMLWEHSEAGTQGDYARVAPRGEEEKPTWRKVHLNYYEALDSYRYRNCPEGGAVAQAPDRLHGRHPDGAVAAFHAAGRTEAWRGHPLHRRQPRRRACARDAMTLASKAGSGQRVRRRGPCCAWRCASGTRRGSRS